jgi:arylsulfatase A-like enzyme
MVRMRLRWLPVLAVSVLAGCGGGEPAAPTARDIRFGAAGKNLVIVLLDATSAHHMSCYGYDRETTPNLDRVAAESVVFDNAYAQASGTMLSVFSFFTSRYPVFDERNFRPWSQVKTIPPEPPTLAERLAPVFEQRLGYTSNVWLKHSLGHDQGFTEYWEMWNSLRPFGEELNSDAVAVRLATKWMVQRADRSFMAYLHLMKPHAPYDPPEPFFSRWAEREIDPQIGTHTFIQEVSGSRPDEDTVRDMVALYDANLAYADHLVGGMIEDLQAAGLWDRTVFVLMADHGQALYELGKPHGHGGTVCEAAIRVPLFVRIPGVAGLAGRRIATPVELVDLMPTLMDLAGLPVPADSLAGRSLLPLLAGEPAPDGDLRLIHSRTNRRNPPIYTLVRGRFKLTTVATGRMGRRLQHALYDLEADPAESVDLLKTEPGHPLGKALQQAMRAWLGSGGAEGATAQAVEFDVFDEAEVQRLKSLGYTN